MSEESYLSIQNLLFGLLQGLYLKLKSISLSPLCLYDILRLFYYQKFISVDISSILIT